MNCMFDALKESVDAVVVVDDAVANAAEMLLMKSDEHCRNEWLYLDLRLNYSSIDLLAEAKMTLNWMRLMKTKRTKMLNFCWIELLI
jgi:hypothetical protein